MSRESDIPTHPSPLARALWWLAWIAMTGWFLSPPLEVINSSLDSSNYGSYSWLAAHRWQFGTDTIAMTGPYGYLAYGTTYTGDLFFARWVGDILLKGALAFLLLELAAGTPAARRGWLALVILFLPNVGDLFPDCTILVATLRLLTGARAGRGNGGALLSAGLLGFMILMKGTNALVAVAALVAVVLQSTIEREHRRTAVVLFTALCTGGLAWIAAGQRLASLPAYLRGVLELSTGYNATMGLPSETRELGAGLVLLIGLLALAATDAWQARRHRGRVLTAVFFAGFAFLKWKHGFVRADGHVFIFFNYALIALALFWLIRRPGEPRGILTVGVSLAIFATGLVASGNFRPGHLVAMVLDQPARLAANARWFFARTQLQAELEAKLARQRQHDDLPAVRSEIGDRSIDFFGFEQGVLLLNRFNYQPRPMGGGTFNVFTRYLQERNDRSVRDPARQPEFQLVKIQTLDGRLATADDPLTLTALLHLYTPRLAEQDYVLFGRSDAPHAPRPEAIASREIALDEFIIPPALAANELLFFSIDASATPAGRLQGLLLRPPLLHVEIETDALQRFRLAPSLAGVPVLLSPLVETTRDLLALYGGDDARHVRRLRFIGDPGIAPRIAITFYKLKAPPAAPEQAAREFQQYLAHPLTNRPPLDVTSGHASDVRELDEKPVLLVHAPGQLTFPIKRGDQQAIFEFGLMPQAYDPGHTKGVEFRVELPRKGSAPLLLFSRFLDPVAEPTDRGRQLARVFLPADIESDRLHLLTLPGPTGDAAWAQSYFRHVQIKSGPVDPRQYSGFNVAPLQPGFAGHPEHGAEGRTVRAFQPTSELRFPIPVDATTVTVATGLQRGAYSGENRSDGVDFAVAIVAEGKAPEPLANWRLDPRSTPRDRGIQTLAIPLPRERPPGSLLVVRVEPGPANDDRWDWSYLESVYFR